MERHVRLPALPGNFQVGPRENPDVWCGFDVASWKRVRTIEAEKKARGDRDALEDAAPVTNHEEPFAGVDDAIARPAGDTVCSSCSAAIADALLGKAKKR